MAQETSQGSASETSSELSGIRLRLNQAVMVMFLVLGLISIPVVLVMNPENAVPLARDGPRGGLIGLILMTPLRFLLPLALFGLAGYSYVYIRRRT